MTGVMASLIDLVQAKHTSKTKSAASDSLSFRDRFAHFSFALADFFFLFCLEPVHRPKLSHLLPLHVT